MAQARKPAEGVTAPPEWLLPEAKAEWLRCWDELARLERLSVVDLKVFEGYCMSYARWREAEAAVDRDGGVVVLRTDKGEVRSLAASPWAGLALKYLTAMKACAVELGLSPASRKRVSPADQAKRPAGVLAPFIKAVK